MKAVTRVALARADDLQVDDVMRLRVADQWMSVRRVLYDSSHVRFLDDPVDPGATIGMLQQIARSDMPWTTLRAGQCAAALDWASGRWIVLVLGDGPKTTADQEDQRLMLLYKHDLVEIQVREETL